MTIIRRKSHTYPGHFKDFFSALISKDWNQGSSLELFESELAFQTNVKYAISTSYGLHALAIILSYYKFNDQTELLIPGYTAKVVQKCLDELNVNYKCIDIDPQRATICPKDFKKKITKQSKGVLVTHLLGNACSEEIFKIAKENGLIIIEDCAHSQGGYFNGKALGSLGDASFYSFSYSKIINTYTGGALLTNNSDLFQFAKESIKLCPNLKKSSLIRKFIMGHFENFIGLPFLTFLLTPFLRSNILIKKIKNIVNSLTRKSMLNFTKYTNTQALLGIKQLEKLPSMLNNKKRIANIIKSKTSINFLDKGDGDVYYNFIAVVPDAKYFHQSCLKMGVDTGYGNSIMEIIADNQHEFPGCKFANDKYLMLPNYDTLTDKQVKKIIFALNNANQNMSNT